MSEKKYDCPYNKGVECTRKPSVENCCKCGWYPEEGQKRIMKRELKKELKLSMSGEIYVRDKQIQRLVKTNAMLSRRCERLRAALDKALEVEDEQETGN